MRVISRRDFGRVVIAAAPIAWIARPLASGPRCPIGVPTSAFNDLPRLRGKDTLDAVIAALAAAGAAYVELALQTVEPAPPNTAPFMGGTPAYPQRVVLTPEQISAMDAQYRSELRAWRLRTPPAAFEDVRERFARARLTVLGCACPFDDSFADDEIEAVFRQVAALGVSTVSSPLTLKTARRLVPFAERHNISVAVHNQTDRSADGAIAAADLADALALSPRMMLKLDVGRLTASNADAAAVLRRHVDRVSAVVVSDHLRNGGAGQPFGEGDTPIKDVLAVLAASGRAVPILVGYDYIGLRSATEEVKASLGYVAGLMR